MIYKSRALNFAFRKLEFDTIYNAYSNKSPFKYYISILGGVGGLRPCLCCLFRGGMGGPELGKTCLYNTCTLPNEKGFGQTKFWSGNNFGLKKLWSKTILIQKKFWSKKTLV